MKVKGFTPAVDEITDRYGGVKSMIYGAIWRYAQMSALGMCTASQEKIGKRAGIERETVNRNIPDMIKDGLIKVGGKAQGGTVAYIPMIDISSIFTMTVTENHPSSDDESLKDVINNHTKKDIKKVKESYAEAIEEGQKLSSAIQDDFRKWLGLTPNWDTKTNQANYQFFRERYRAGETAQQFKEWWVAEDWRGVEGQMPSFNNVREMWGQAFLEKKNPLAMSAIERGANKVY